MIENGNMNFHRKRYEKAEFYLINLFLRKKEKWFRPRVLMGKAPPPEFSESPDDPESWPPILFGMISRHPQGPRLVSSEFWRSL